MIVIIVNGHLLKQEENVFILINEIDLFLFLSSRVCVRVQCASQHGSSYLKKSRCVIEPMPPTSTLYEAYIPDRG